MFDRAGQRCDPRSSVAGLSGDEGPQSVLRRAIPVGWICPLPVVPGGNRPTLVELTLPAFGEEAELGADGNRGRELGHGHHGFLAHSRKADRFASSQFPRAR